MKRIVTLTLLTLLVLCTYAQNGTFIFVTGTKQLYSITVDKTGTQYGAPTLLTLCSNIAAPLSIALDNTTLYTVDNKGVLYSSTFSATTGTLTNCTKLSTASNGFTFTKLTGIYGLTVDSKGVVYAASGSEIQTYNSTTKTFSALHTIQSQWTIAGDILFWGGSLYEACVDGSTSTSTQVLVKIDTANYNSSLYLTFHNAIKKKDEVFGIASVKVPCDFNQPFAITQAGDITAIDMYAKKENPTKLYSIATMLGVSGITVNDAASIAESGLNQKPTPPANPVTPNDICVGQPFAFSVGINDPTNDVLHWFTPPNIPPSNNNFSLTTPIVNVNAVGSTRYLITEFNNSTGCESDTVSILVNVHPYPTKPVVTVSADTVCNGFAATLTITPATLTASASYQWGNAQGNVGANSATYSATTTNTYAVKATAFGCSTASDSIKIKVLNSAITYSGNPFCNTGTANVTQSGDNEGGVYSANSTDLIIDSKTGQIDLAKSKAGTYTVTYTLNGSIYICPYTTSVTINASSTSSTTISICQGSSYSFNGTNYTKAGTYIAKLPNSKGCDSTATLVLSIKLPSGSSTAIVICPKQLPYTWNGKIYAKAATDTIHFTNSAGCDSTTILILTVSNTVVSTTTVSLCPPAFPYTWNGKIYTGAGSYNDTLKNSVGCDSIATLVLILIPKATVSPIAGSSAVEINQSITLTDPTVGGAWAITPTSVATIDNSGKVTGISLGTATVAYTISNAPCGSDTAFYKVIVSSQEVFIPNLFSPNGDNNGNDVFYVRGIFSAYSSVKLTIFDSWGNLMFESTGNLNDASNGWKGDYKGKPQPPGAYVYIARLTVASTGQTIIKKGIINLIR